MSESDSNTKAPNATSARVQLSRFRSTIPVVAASRLKRRLWQWANALLVMNPLNTSSRLRIVVLRAFGAKIGPRTQIRSKVNVSEPWHLEIAEDTWIGEGAWIDSLAPVRIGANVCISQQAYLCCGNHDWTSPYFDARYTPITVEDGAWIAIRAIVMGGVTVGSHSVLVGGAVATRSLPPYSICAGNPASPVRSRRIVEPPSDAALDDDA